MVKQGVQHHCDKCNYTTASRSDFTKHSKTTRHLASSEDYKSQLSLSISTKRKTNSPYSCSLCKTGQVFTAKTLANHQQRPLHLHLSTYGQLSCFECDPTFIYKEWDCLARHFLSNTHINRHLDIVNVKSKVETICPHGKSQKYDCTVCNDCGHNNLKRRCKICSDCGHGTIKYQCTVCSDCGHGTTKKNCSVCSDCGHGKLKKRCNICSNCGHMQVKNQCVICSDCGHGKIKSHCQECSNCGHGKIKSHCQECSSCGHGKLRFQCAFCSDCGHGKIKVACVICSDCGHGMLKKSCIICSNCGHGKLKSYCSICSDCGHGKLKTYCNICSDCGHGKAKSLCSQCAGHFCEHGIQRSTCRKCDGKRMCESCKQTVQGRFKPFCVPCYYHHHPEIGPPKSFRTRQNHLFHRIQQDFPGLFTYDKSINEGCSRRRPDVFVDCFTHTLHCENDENQHRNVACENRRTMELFLDTNSRPQVTLRFNPDSYTDLQGVKHQSCFFVSGASNVLCVDEERWEERYIVLHSRLKFWLGNVPKKEITNEYLFFDNWNPDHILVE